MTNCTGDPEPTDHSCRVLWDWPHREDIEGDWFESSLQATRVGRIAARITPLRGPVLWWMARRYDVLVMGLAGTTTRIVLALDRLTRNPRRYIVLLHFIPEVTVVPANSAAGWIINVLKILNLKFIVRPAVQRNVVRCQVLTTWEINRNADFFGVERGRMTLTPYPLRWKDDVMPPQVHDGGVLASGRAACDWPTVFAAATLGDWPLTVVCGARDRRLVESLNASGRATVHFDISLDQHAELMRSASVYLLALRDHQVSSGQIRLSDTVRTGTPIVLSEVPGVLEYVSPEETALVFPPGDPVAAARKIGRLFDDPALGARLRQSAFERAGLWTREQYRDAMIALVLDAAEEASGRAAEDTQ
jgi:Glycosyl transferases group 1